jgi:hypothetical protein
MYDVATAYGALKVGTWDDAHDGKIRIEMWTFVTKSSEGDLETDCERLIVESGEWNGVRGTRLD